MASSPHICACGHWHWLHDDACELCQCQAFTPKPETDGEKIKRLERELAEARKDTERLDWLEYEAPDIQQVNATQDPQDGMVWCIDGYPVCGETLRAAIDDAAKEPKS